MSQSCTPRNQNKYSGSTPRVSILVLWESYIRFIYSVNTTPRVCILTVLGELPQVLYHFCGSAPTRVVRETCLLIREYSQYLLGPFLWEHSYKHGIAVLGVLLKTQNNYYWEYSQTCLKSGRSHIFLFTCR